MNRILIVMGTRPEAIKMAPVIAAFRNDPEVFDVTVCITAQHREQLDSVLEIFNISPDIDLNIMQQGQDLYDVTTGVLTKMKSVLEKVEPDVVLVQGDTTTTFAATLAAFYQKIDVAHIEAGLRTENIYAPYPEEVNRRLTSGMARYHFAPTESNRQNLLKENIKDKDIIVTGNTVIDALLMVLDRIKGSRALEEETVAAIRNAGFVNFRAAPYRRYILVTGHRRENFGQGFLNICEGIKRIADRHPDIDMVYPVHLNPNVQGPVGDILSDVSNVYLVAPLDYILFVYLMAQSYFIITDSGGIQEEAPSLGKPTLVMRDTTERPEAVDAGTVKLVGTDPDTIFHEAELLLTDENAYKRMAEAHNPYGDGKAADRIVTFIKEMNNINHKS